MPAAPHRRGLGGGKGFLLLMMNQQDKTIFIGDNLLIMRGMNSESVDLIYLDPPFNSNANYAAPIGSAAAGAEFKDTWSLADVDITWLDLIETKHPKLNRVIHAAMSDSDKSYLIYMAVRLLEMHRLLKSTGSIYLHCDPTMSHYLKLVMDSVFGTESFRNEIVWRRATAHNDPRRYGNNSDRLLYYSAGGQPIWNGSAIAVPKSPEEIESAYKSCDERGRYRSDNLTGPSHGSSGGESAQSWSGYDINARGRVWSAPKTGAYAKWIEDNIIPNYRSIEGVHDRLDALDAADLIYHPSNGVWPGLKRYAAADTGNPVQSLFTDISGFTNYNTGGEWTGYPTQKPVKLLERIIKASSNPNDVILDPFCGCATTLVAADRLQRQWIGIDVSPKAAELVVQRIKADQGLFQDITHRADIPKRTDLGALPPYNCRENKQTLYGVQGGHCNGCQTHFQAQHLEVDHIIATSVGGTDHLDNLQLLCSNCNRIKGNRGQEYLINKLAEA